MRLEQLEYLIAIRRYGSMSAAGESLHVSPQTLSIAIKNLENELGLKVLERTPQGTLVNSAGEYIIELSREILERVKQIKDFAQDTTAYFGDRELIGKLSVSFTLPAMHANAGNIIKSFRNKYPQINLHFRAIKHSGVLDALLGNEIDFGYINMSSKFFDEEFLPRYAAKIEAIPISHGKMGVIVSKKSSLVQQKSVSLKSLRSYVKVTYDREHFHFMGVADKLFPKNTTEMLVECTDKDLLWDLVCRNKAVALSTCGCYHMYDQSFRNDMSNIILEDNLDVLTLLCLPKGRKQTIASEKFKNFFLDFMSVEH